MAARARGRKVVVSRFKHRNAMNAPLFYLGRVVFSRPVLLRSPLWCPHHGGLRASNASMRPPSKTVLTRTRQNPPSSSMSKLQPSSNGRAAGVCGDLRSCRHSGAFRPTCIRDLALRCSATEGVHEAPGNHHRRRPLRAMMVAEMNMYLSDGVRNTTSMLGSMPRFGAAIWIHY